MSTMRKKAKEKEDLPLPVLPQIPTWKQTKTHHDHQHLITDLLHFSRFNTQVSSGYLLPRADVRIDIFEHGLQRGVVSDAQILDLDLSLSGPAVGDLRHSWDRHRNISDHLDIIVISKCVIGGARLRLFYFLKFINNAF